MDFKSKLNNLLVQYDPTKQEIPVNNLQNILTSYREKQDNTTEAKTDYIINKKTTFMKKAESVSFLQPGSYRTPSTINTTLKSQLINNQLPITNTQLLKQNMQSKHSSIEASNNYNKFTDNRSMQRANTVQNLGNKKDKETTNLDNNLNIRYRSNRLKTQIESEIKYYSKAKPTKMISNNNFDLNTGHSSKQSSLDFNFFANNSNKESNSNLNYSNMINSNQRKESSNKIKDSSKLNLLSNDRNISNNTNYKVKEDFLELDFKNTNNNSNNASYLSNIKVNNPSSKATNKSLNYNTCTIEQSPLREKPSFNRSSSITPMNKLISNNNTNVDDFQFESKLDCILNLKRENNINKNKNKFDFLANNLHKRILSDGLSNNNSNNNNNKDDFYDILNKKSSNNYSKDITYTEERSYNNENNHNRANNRLLTYSNNNNILNNKINSSSNNTISAISTKYNSSTFRTSNLIKHKDSDKTDTKNTNKNSFHINKLTTKLSCLK